MTAYNPDDPTARVEITEVEVTATPEEVWRAIATGPGIEAWFTRAEVEEREGGAIVTHHGPFGDSPGTVVVWDPPHRLVYEEREWNPDAPPWATEILVEARGGGTCLVRLVSGFFTDGEGWEDQLEGSAEGWRAALRNLRLYFAHFAGLPAATMWTVGTVPGDRYEAAKRLFAALDLDGAAPGQRVTLEPPAPVTAGVVEEVLPVSVLLRTDLPMPGIVELGVWQFEEPVAMVRAYLYGDGGRDVAARADAQWSTWLREHLEGFTPLQQPTYPGTR